MPDSFFTFLVIIFAGALAWLIHHVVERIKRSNSKEKILSIEEELDQLYREIEEEARSRPSQKSHNQDDISEDDEDDIDDVKAFYQRNKAVIDAAEKPMIRIKADQTKKPGLTSSKFGGLPYWPQGMDYPTDPEGKPLHLLAQINFEELPKLKPFPNTGLLQFFISSDNGYGADRDHPSAQKGFRVVYHQTYDPKSQQNLEAMDLTSAEHELPFHSMDGFALSFTTSTQIPSSDIYNETITAQLSEEDRELFIDYFYHDWEDRFSDGIMHQMGGYPNLCQGDPRDAPLSHDRTSKDFLLLQIDSDSANQIRWGDSGTAAFFISEKDLKKRDFSNVMYYWDCF
ncbi:MAG: YwqG family protein [Holosporales bacterium]